MDNCYKDRIPRELQSDQNERLTSKHIQTLSFLQDMAKENKELKQKVAELEKQQTDCVEIHSFAEKSQKRIEEIQQEYMRRADEMNVMLAEKHRLEMEQMAAEKCSKASLEEEMLEQMEKIIAEKKALEEAMEQLRKERRTLIETNRELMDKLGTLSEADENANLMYMELQEVKGELSALKEENSHLKKTANMKASDLQQFQDFRQQCSSLQEELLAVTQQKNELEIRVKQLKGELEDGKADRDKGNLANKLGKKVLKLNKEKKELEEQLATQSATMEDMQADLEQTRMDLATVHRHQQITMMEYKKLAAEVETLRKHSASMQDKASFRDFVGLKRELNSLKEENEELRHRTRITVDTLPCLATEPPVRKGSASKTKPPHVLALPASIPLGPIKKV